MRLLKEIFVRLSSRYEAIPFPFTYVYYFAAKRRRKCYERLATEVVSKIESGRVLDIGTGPGFLPVEISKKAPNIEVIGIDVSESMIRIARKYVRKQIKADKVSFQVMSAYSLDFPDRYFDLVISTGVLHHLKDLLTAFNETYRVLKQGGEGWMYELITDAGVRDMEKFMADLSISPLFLTAKIWRLHGLKYHEYVRGSIKQAIEQSTFAKYELIKKNALMKIVLKR